MRLRVVALTMGLLAALAASTFALADPIYPAFTSSSTAANVTASGGFIGGGPAYGSSAFSTTNDQARSFVNLATGEIGAYVAGDQSQASTSTQAGDQWLCNNCAGIGPDFVSFGFNLGITATLNEATEGAFKELDYTLTDSLANQLDFSAATDGPNDYELSASWNGQDISSSVTQSFDANGTWTLSLNYSYSICDPGETCILVLPSGWLPYTPQWSVSASVDNNGTPQFIDSARSFHFNTFSNLPLTSLGGASATLVTEPTTVPEPPTALLLLPGLLLLLFFRRLAPGASMHVS